jgi:predicted P-loop ATPase
MPISACEVLAGQWFSDCMPDVRSKDAQQYLRGKWLIEVAEMHAMTRATVAAIKAFITRREERYRPSHGRLEVTEKRACLFIGTTNQEVYLKDETGGRRFWPVRCGPIIDIEGLRRDRDQLFAEAVALYRKGCQWWPDREFERRCIVPQQEARFDEDPWQEPIAKGLDRSQQGYCSPDITVEYVATKFLGLETINIGKREQMRIAAIMTRLGWRRNAGRRYWVPAR